MKLALISDSAAALRACLRLARQLRQAGVEVTLITAPGPPSRFPHFPRPADPPARALVLEPLAAAVSELMDHLDGAGVFLEADTLQPFLAAHRQAARLRGRAPRPLFSGPLLPLVGDALSADLLPRLGYDLICLHGSAQVEELGWLIRGTTHADQANVAIGLWTVPSEPIGLALSEQPQVLVLEQRDLPASAREKALLYRRLQDLALASPGWTVRLQPDYSLPSDPELWEETTLAWHHRQDESRPANLQLGDHEDLPLSLMQAWACLGISSPWLLSAMVWGKPTAVLGDYGIRTEFDGPLFFGSGLMRRLADCQPLDHLLAAPPANPGWLADLGWAIADGPWRLKRQLEALAR
ncbi:hypothetical protein KBY96_10070 [Cyanobium sp. ATX 6A2]|uniref:DUF6716 putative glycosyltransferase n=1 Tax=Cyanobium sp. ATX 6A2 TaxID=2823700 RepID=UPI0020CE2F85|nr:DUF6716 putative glycosyltransferase [Cyanobium sp. ATX 6A2]MCP9888270.1 hypothetical protein [Cyanobium sp. ATX 6A2]